MDGFFRFENISAGCRFEEGEYPSFHQNRDARNSKEDRLRKLRGATKASDVLLRELQAVREKQASSDIQSTVRCMPPLILKPH
eukprot:2180653-Prymnesium_polylepis.2